MRAMSKALRIMLAREYEELPGTEQMKGAASIAPDASPADQVRLGLLQMLLPDLVSEVERLIVETTGNDAARSMAGGLLTYVCNPLDLIGDDQPLGRVDDAMVCALGLKRLEKLHGIKLTARASAVCEVATESMRHVSEDLRHGVEDFVADIEQSTRDARSS